MGKIIELHILRQIGEHLSFASHAILVFLVLVFNLVF